MTEIYPADGAKLTLSDAELAAEFESARPSRGIRMGEKAIMFIGDMGENLYVLRDELVGGSWMNSPRICSS